MSKDYCCMSKLNILYKTFQIVRVYFDIGFEAISNHSKVNYSQVVLYWRRRSLVGSHPAGLDQK